LEGKKAKQVYYHADPELTNTIILFMSLYH